MTAKHWYTIENIDTIDTPALAIYPERVKENIARLKKAVPDSGRLRPHVKTHKSAEATRLLLAAGIHKFKCATIAEAEMLALAGAQDVLLAYQPVGPKAVRLAQLIMRYPATTFSCLTDNADTARRLDAVMQKINHCLPVYIDLNVGMNRTGIRPGPQAIELYEQVRQLPGLLLMGLHAYDGHIRDQDIAVRTQRCNEGFEPVTRLAKELAKDDEDLVIIAGGSPTFPIHAARPEVECSPGTFIYWDKGYSEILPEQPFQFAALVIARVVSIPTENTVCIDLGHKAIAPENALDRRVFFLNAPDLQPAGHSEEHMTWRTTGENTYKVGDVLYGVPYHVCPTCALHASALAVTDHKVTGEWTMDARSRAIGV